MLVNIMDSRKKNTKWINTVVLSLSLTSVLLVIILVFEPFTMLPNLLRFEQDVIHKFNSTILNLSQGVVVSSLFYWLVVMIPEREKAKQVRLLYISRLKYLTQKVFELNLFIEYRFSTGEKFSNLSGPPRFEWKLVYKEGAIKFGTNAKTVEGFLKSNVFEIDRLVKEIFGIPNVSDEQEDLIFYLVSLLDCGLIRNIGHISDRHQISSLDQDKLGMLMSEFVFIKDNLASILGKDMDFKVEMNTP